jgi:hypothetical protein
MDATSTFLLEVVLKNNCRTREETNGSPASDRTVIVEISSAPGCFDLGLCPGTWRGGIGRKMSNVKTRP